MVGKHEIAKRMNATLADSVGIKLLTEILHLKPDQIEPDPEQPRQDFDNPGLARLAESLRKYGQLQPVLVRKQGTKYFLVAGERRWRAAKLAGMQRVQALLCRGGDVRSIQLIENLLREDLKPIEQARAFKAIIEKEKWSARELARQLSIEHSSICKALAMLHLPEEVQSLVNAGDIPPTTAYEISKRPKQEHVRLAKAAATGKIKGEDLRRKPDQGHAVMAPPAKAPSLTLGVPAKVSSWPHQAGKVRVEVTGFRDHAELVRALEAALAHAKKTKPALAGGLGR